MSVSVIVVKIGGSLFTQPNLVHRLIEKVDCLSSFFSPAHLVLVTGGGGFVNSLREIDRVNVLACDVAHWTAIRLMDINSSLLQDWWPELDSVNSLGELRLRCEHSGVSLFRVEEFLRHEEPSLPGTQLPVGWEVTSDSIAARVAELLAAKQLILLKPECSLPTQDWALAADFGLVDQYFPKIASHLSDTVLDTF